MSFESRFKKKNKGIAASSVKTYLANIRRLAKAMDHEKIPDSGDWVKSKKLLTWLRKQNLNTRKILSAAGVKAAQTYGEGHGGLSKIMEKATKEYETERGKQKKTKREAILMPKTGYAAVGKAAAKLRAQVPPKIRNMRDYMILQDAWLLSFFAKHTPRLIESVAIGKGKNRIQSLGNGWKITLGQHKTAKSQGKSIIKLDKSLNEITSRLIKSRLPQIKHNFLLSAPRGGKMSKSALSQRLTKITGKALGRGFSSQILRVLKATSQDATMKKVRLYLNEMGHGIQEERRYVAK